jgi:uncharacterized membrane protein
MILVGVVYCFLLGKIVKPEFMAGILVALAMLAICIFVPLFSAIANMTRFYHFSLFFIAPCFVLGFAIFKRFKFLIITFIFIVYYAFVSGIVFEVTKVPDITKLQIPYSYALSAERAGGVGIFTQDDLNCADWLSTESDSAIMIDGDQSGVALVSSYMWIIPRLIVKDSAGVFHRGKNESVYYLFLTDWNIRNNKMMNLDESETIGLRTVTVLPNLENELLVYQSGNARVYLIGGVK